MVVGDVWFLVDLVLCCVPVSTALNGSTNSYHLYIFLLALALSGRDRN